MRNEIIRLDNQGSAFAVIKDIAEYCEVNENSVRKLVQDNIESFNQVTQRIEDGLRCDLKSHLKVALKLETSATGKSIDWSKTKLYQPHIELLLMFMKNTKSVKLHKVNLIADFFLTKFELMESRLQNQQLLIDKSNQALIIAEAKLDKIELDKFNDWDEEYSSASRYIKDNKISLTSSELLDMLENAKQIETKQITKQVRMLSEESDGRVSSKGTLLFQNKLLKRLLDNN